MTARSRGAAVQRARLLHERGIGATNAGHAAEGARTLRRALALLGDASDHRDDIELTGRIWLSLAYAESELGGLAAGLRALHTSEDYARQAPGSDLPALVHAQRGVMYLRSGRNREAMRELDAAVASADRVQPTARCNILLTRGTARLYEGNLHAARADFSRCVAVAVDNGLALEQHKGRHNLGYLEFLAGDLPRALQEMAAAAQVEVGLPKPIPLLDRARVLVEAGLIREADDALTEAASIFAAERLGQDLAETDLARARCALLAGQPDAAARLARRARTRFGRRGNDRWRRAAELVLLTARLALGRDVAVAAQRLAADLQAQGHPAQVRTAALLAAESMLDRGRVAEAQRLAATAGALGRGDRASTRLHTRYLRARLSRATGEPAAAAREVRTGLHELATYQSSFGSVDLQTASAIHGRRLAELGVAIAVEDGSPARVLSAVERGRAVSSRLPPVRPPADDRAAALLAELRQVIEEARGIGDGRDARTGAAALDRRRREIERRIKALSWVHSGAGTAQRPASIGALRDGLGTAGASLVSYLRMGGALHAVVVGPRRATLHALGDAGRVEDLVRRARADLDVLAHRTLPGRLRAVARASLRTALTALDDTLLAPLRLGSTRVVITPTGVLATLPWGATATLRGVPVTVAPSATAWLAAASVPAAGGTGRVTAVAGPGLARADDEVAGVTSAWGARRAFGRVGADGTRAALTDALATSSLVHVAAHGTHQTGNPLFSSIRLADGPLFAYELDRAAEQVILSACDLGLATVRPGDEALGLTSVLLRLGTRCVVAGVARVPDDVAADVMVRCHSRLAAGRDPATALAEATSTYDEPVPFVCFGASWRAAAG